MISDLPLPVSPVSRLSPGPNLTLDSATRARSRTLSSLSKLLLGDQRAAPTKLVGEPLIEGFRRAQANDLEALRVRSAADHIADQHLVSAPLTVDPHLGRAANDSQADLLSRCEDNRPDREREG